MPRNVMPADLAAMRRAAQSLLQPGFSIRSVTRTLDRYGNESYAFPIVSTVEGTLENTSGQEQRLLAALSADGVLRTETAKIRLPYGTAVTTEQVIASPDSRYWNVAHIGSDTHAAFTVVLATRREVSNG